MNEILPAWPWLSAFLAASLVLAISPGPGVFYIVARSLAQGRRSGLASVAGVALGNLGNAVGASLGLAALFAVSSVAFTIVKYLGAVYLVYLGVQALRARRLQLESAELGHARLSRIFRDGLVVALFNPKTAVFFAAFLPQFINSGTAPTLQSVVLGAMFVAIAAVTDTVSRRRCRARSRSRQGNAAAGPFFHGGRIHRSRDVYRLFGGSRREIIAANETRRIGLHHLDSPLRKNDGIRGGCCP